MRRSASVIRIEEMGVFCSILSFFWLTHLFFRKLLDFYKVLTHVKETIGKSIGNLEAQLSETKVVLNELGKLS